MKFAAIVWLIVLLLVLASQARGEGLLGDTTERQHFAYHFLASGAIYTGSYLFVHDVLGCDKTDSFIFSAFTALLIGLLAICCICAVAMAIRMSLIAIRSTIHLLSGGIL